MLLRAIDVQIIIIESGYMFGLESCKIGFTATRGRINSECANVQNPTCGIVQDLLDMTPEKTRLSITCDGTSI